MALQPGLHDVDLVLLLGNDAQRQVADLRILCGEQDGLGHVDATL